MEATTVDRVALVSVRLRASMLAHIDAIANAEELTRTDVLRRLLRSGLAQHDRDRKGRP